MKLQIKSAAEILERQICGFRRYSLQEPIAPIFISQNLCDMIGYSKEELLDGGYVSAIHPEDRDDYESFLKGVTETGTGSSAEYRLIKKNGAVIYVRDTITAEREKGGALIGNAVLTDITDIKSENASLRFLNDTVPCGMVKYTCEKNPRVTYVNDRMLKMLRMEESRDGELDYLEFYKENIYFLIPPEGRRKFAHFLDQVQLSGVPVSGEMTLLRCDGTRLRVFGWVTKVTAEDGTEEFQSVCMDVTERYRANRAGETERYIKALSEVYEKIFEYDFGGGTVKYIHGGSDTFGRIKNLPMQMEEATEQWIDTSVYEEDRGPMKTFFKEVFSSKGGDSDSRPPRIEYRSVSSKGTVGNFVGTFLKLGGSVSLFCCKRVADGREMAELRNENTELKNNMREFVTRFTEGVMAFKVDNGFVKPMYASDNVCNFFGYKREDWLAMAERSCSIKEFISQSSISYEEVETLFATGEAEFTYFDIAHNRTRLIKAICSRRSSEGDAPFYVLLYNVDNGQSNITNTAADEQTRIYIRTFGYFDVFVNDRPIAFRNKKAKELLALLVDRRGGYVTGEEAIGYLWEDEPANAVTLARYRKEALRLKNTLEEYGIADIIEAVDGKRRIVPENIRCDLYDYLSGKPEFAALFKGSYLSNYTWGEITLGELINDGEKDKTV